MTGGAAAIGVAAAAACLASAAASLGLARLGARLRLVDRPGPRKPQPRPVATVGGVGIAIGVAAGLAVEHALAPAGSTGFVAAAARSGAIALLCFLVGLADDLSAKRLSAGTKAVATLLALVAPLFVLGDRGGAAAWLALLPFAFVALHAMNTVDHANGLSGLVAFAGAAAFAVAAALRGPALEPGLAQAGVLATLLAAALLGFLFLNYPRGRVYLGDSGTLLLGGCLAAALLETGRPELLLLAAVPLADLGTVAWLRARAGARPWLGDRRHVTHRLVERGMAEAAAVGLLAAVQAGCSALAAVGLARRWGDGAAWGSVAAVIGVLALGMLLVAPAREAAARAVPAGAPPAAPPGAPPAR